MINVNLANIQYLDTPINLSCKLISCEIGASEDVDECITYTYELMQFSHTFTISFEAERYTKEEDLSEALRRAAISLIFAKISQGIKSGEKSNG